MDASAPRVSASLLLTRDDPFRVLLVRRSSRSTFPSAFVFPGGVVEDSDLDERWEALVDGSATGEARSLRVAALRETWEETGIVAARTPTRVLLDADRAIGSASFLDLLETSGAVLPLDDVLEFGHWITPVSETRRFDTWFFLMAGPEDQEAVADGIETVQAMWVQPAEAFERGTAGDLPIVFPTLMNLARLAESVDSGAAISEARLRRSFAVNPVVEVRSDGSRWIVIPREAGYPATEWPAVT